MSSFFKTTIFFFACFVFTCLPAKASRLPAAYINNQVLVKFKDQTSTLKLKNTGLTTIETLDSQTLLLEIQDGQSVSEKIDLLNQKTEIDFVQPNFIYYPQSLSNDPLATSLWALENHGQAINGVSGTTGADMNLTSAWASATSSSIIVGVVDTGVAYDHEDLAANMWDGKSCLDENGNFLGNCLHGYDFANNDPDPYPLTSDHGTHVAGTIAAVGNNNLGIIGVAPQAKIMALRVDGDDGTMSTVDIIRAIKFADHNGAKILNMSLGTNPFSCTLDNYDQLYYQALRDFSGLVFVSAGNESTQVGDKVVTLPASFAVDTTCWSGLDNVLSVAATDSDDNLADFSNYGNVSLAAPGGSFSQRGVFHGQSLINSTVADLSFDHHYTNFDQGLPAGWTTTGTFGLDNPFSDPSDYVLIGDTSYFPYSSNNLSSVTTNTYDLSGKQAFLDMLVICDTEAYPLYDYLEFKISKDNGQTYDSNQLNFGVIDSESGGILSVLDEYILQIIGGQSVSGFAYGKVFSNIPIPKDYATTGFKIKIEWQADGADNNQLGCFIDDFDLKTTKTTAKATNLYGFKNGTSMAAPNATGVAAFIWGTAPMTHYSAIADALQLTGDSAPQFVGQVNSQTRINAQQALAYVTSLNQILPVITSLSLTQNGQTPTRNFVIGDQVEFSFTADQEIFDSVFTFNGRDLPVTTQDHLNFHATTTLSASDHAGDFVFSLHSYQNKHGVTGLPVSTLDQTTAAFATFEKKLHQRDFATLLNTYNLQAVEGNYNLTTQLQVMDRFSLFDDSAEFAWNLTFEPATYFGLVNQQAFDSHQLKIKTVNLPWLDLAQTSASQAATLQEKDFGVGSRLLTALSFDLGQQDWQFSQPVSLTWQVDPSLIGTKLALVNFDNQTSTWSSQYLDRAECLVDNLGRCTVAFTQTSTIALIQSGTPVESVPILEFVTPVIINNQVEQQDLYWSFQVLNTRESHVKVDGQLPLTPVAGTYQLRLKINGINQTYSQNLLSSSQQPTYFSFAIPIADFAASSSRHTFAGPHQLEIIDLNSGATTTLPYNANFYFPEKHVAHTANYGFHIISNRQELN